ncbi:MAG: hypothetical protein KDD78_03645 [Caldilineaceae bacterium]|nr:hypothetical protein [Caldilineaceae bacterium]
MDSLLVVGSSIFAQWRNAAAIAPGTPLINRAVGGTLTRDWVVSLPSVLTATPPGAMLFYCGSNDINHGVTDSAIVANVMRCRAILAELAPDAPMAYFGIIKAPQKVGHWTRIDRLNATIRAGLALNDLYVESNDLFFHAGQPVARWFVEDGLHLTDAAYAALTTFVRPQVAAWRGLPHL